MHPRTRWLGLLIVACAFSALMAARPLLAADKKATKKHFLWKVQSKTAIVYLLGSVHAAKKELYPLDKAITDAFAESDKVVFEAPLDSRALAETARKMAKIARYPAGDSLDKHLDKETKALFDAYVKKSKINPSVLNQFRPWMVSMSITMLELQRNGYSAKQGIDLHFLEKAKAKKGILALETLDDQVALFQNLDDKTQMLMLKQTLEDSDKIGETLDKVFKSWNSGDTAALDKLMLKPMRAPEYKTLYKALFVDRNRKMLKKINGYLKTDSTYFVIVGAGHLVGKDGLVQRLKAKKNYRIDQQ